MTRRFVLQPDKDDVRDKTFRKFKFGRLPARVDLRTQMPPVANQGTIGACTAHALSALMWYLEHRNGNGAHGLLSRLFLYFNEREMEGTINEDAGASLRTGIKSLVRSGICGEELWPYEENRFAERPSDEAYADAADHKAIRYARVNDLYGMKACLSQGYPVAFGVDVYPSFESDETCTSGNIPMPSSGEESLGGHAVLAVGYDDERQTLIIRNSWGQEAGDHGYFYLPYDYFTRYAMDCWVVYNEGRAMSTVRRLAAAFTR